MNDLVFNAESAFVELIDNNKFDEENKAEIEVEPIMYAKFCDSPHCCLDSVKRPYFEYGEYRVYVCLKKT